MAIEIFNRLEKKYLIRQEEYQKVIHSIKDKMVLDEYNKNGKPYNISNIYYDTPNDELIRKSIEKPVYKEKLRLRSYGIPSMEDQVFLEIKKKYKGIVNKRRTVFKLSEAYDFIENGVLPTDLSNMNPQVFEELKYFLSIYNLSAKLYLTYDRFAYFAEDNVDFRVTFDTNIITRRESVKLELGNQGDLLIGNDLWLMEVKAIGGVPLWFANILSDNQLYPVSFSKYGTEYKKQMKGNHQLCLKQSIQQQQEDCQLIQQSLVS